MSHTPTPWSFSEDDWHLRAGDGLSVGEVHQSMDDAVFILKAVNAHEGLVATLNRIAARAHYLADDTAEDMKRDLYHCEMLAVSALAQIK